MASFRALIAGAGGAGKSIARCLREDGRAEPAAFFEPLAEQREKAALEFPRALVGDDYHDLLHRTLPDIAVIAGPDHLHAEQAILALEHGCHLLIEKPMATTVADARRLLDAERASGRHVMIDFTCRYMHPWGTMARAAKAGAVGAVFFLEGNYIHDMWDFYNPAGAYYTSWRVDREFPQDILLGGGCHGLDLMLWVMEDIPVTEVYAGSNALAGSDLPIDDCYLVNLRFANGVIGKLFVTGGCNGAEFGRFLEVFGADGTLREGRLLRRNREPVELAPDPAHRSAGGHGWPGAVADFLSVVEGKIPNPLPSVAGARNVAVCEAAIRSAREGGVQPVEWFA
jgi:predicted dehydrogenase